MFEIFIPVNSPMYVTSSYGPHLSGMHRFRSLLQAVYLGTVDFELTDLIASNEIKS